MTVYTYTTLGGNKLKGTKMTIEIRHDQSPESPLTWSNLGTMLCNVKNHNIGDRQNPYSGTKGSHLKDFKLYLKEVHDVKIQDVLHVPLYAYIHSGISLSHTPFEDKWDAGQVGYHYVLKSRVRSDFLLHRISKKALRSVYDIFENELRDYNNYLQGDCYGYIITDKDSIVDSCWGFSGDLEDVKKCMEDNLPVGLPISIQEQLNNIKYEDII